MLDANNHRGRFAEHYVRTLAAAAGLVIDSPDWDDGIDMTLRSPEGMGPASRPRIDVQVKSWSRPRDAGAFYIYDRLSEVQFNQLAAPESMAKRYLFVVLVPYDTGALADLYTRGTLFRYYANYVSLHGQDLLPDPSKDRKKKVQVPKANVLTVRTLRELLQLDAVAEPWT